MAMGSLRWYQPGWITGGNTLQLLQGSHEFFSALVAAVDCSEESIWLESYIFDTAFGAEAVCQALMRAAQRGVTVRLLLDGVGSGTLQGTVQEQRLRDAGVQLRYFAPPGRLGLLLPKFWRRLHRKLCVIDGQMAFCGGINILDDYHDPNHGALRSARWDFSVQITAGRLVQHIAAVCDSAWHSTREHTATDMANRLRGTVQRGQPHQHKRSPNDSPPDTVLRRQVAEKFAACFLSTQTHFPQVSGCRVRLLLRDNLRNRHSIEKAYLTAIAQAQHRIVIANAYFFPSNRLLKALTQACRRGVTVQLLLQGRYEYFMQYYAIRALYPRLIAAGMEIYEYTDSFLHGKVAVVDAQEPHAWATVGSSNLDPLSLLLAREANVEVLDAKFASVLQQAIEQALLHSSEHIDEKKYLIRRSWWKRRLDRFAYFWARFATWVFSSEY